MKAKEINDQIEQVRKVIEAYGDLFLVGGLDNNGEPHIADFGIETKVMKEIMPYARMVSAMVAYYFHERKLERNKEYILKFSLNRDCLIRTESFGALPKIPALRKVG